MEPIRGIHHITAMASDPQVNLDFYQTVLGQRLIKTTVNFDDPGTYHLYYGDETGTPGTLLTFFPWPTARPGVPGNGEVSAIAYAIGPESVDFWAARLKEFQVSVGESKQRFGQTVIPFRDPDGMMLELVTSQNHAAVERWTDGLVPEDYVIQGFYGATLWVDNASQTGRLLQEHMGYSHAGTEDARHRYVGAGENIGLVIDLLERPDQPRARLGAGSVHHIAFQTINDNEQQEYLSFLRQQGYQVTPVQDRQYFISIYFREPNGVLFELATNGPGFLIDESVDELGSNLRLPPWYESHRAEIEQALQPLDRKIKLATEMEAE
jgi:glyoxalase family protein